MANGFKNINYGRQLYESLRAYYAVNSSGSITGMYKFLIAILQVLQAPFDGYNAYRNKEALIASCKWQIGQLTNVLNYLYDPIQNRIFITQSTISRIDDPTFAYAPYNFDKTFSDSPPAIFERTFNDRSAITNVIINVPAGSNITDLIATVEQIKLSGIEYTIQTF